MAATRPGERWKHQPQAAGGLTYIHRAALLFPAAVLFRGRVKGRVYGTAVMLNPRINLLRMKDELSAVHLQLVGGTIEHFS